MTSREDVINGYRLFLGRLPENEEVISRHIAHAQDLAALRSRFLSSPEFYRSNSREILHFFSKWQAERRAGQIDYDCSEAELDILFSHIRDVWTNLGKIEPHYSVSSTQNFKPENFEANRADFEKSGKNEVDLLLSELEQHSLSKTKHRHCVELGSGVGRVSRFLAGIADRVSGFDVSQPHLDIASEYLTRNHISNVSLHHVSHPDDFIFTECDLIYSRIVLQHNPPPIQLFLIRKMLNSLTGGGVAVFQIPTYIEGYSFNLNSYLEGEGQINDQELHALPQKAIFKAVSDAGCEIVSVYRDNSLSRITSDSTKFLVKRP